MVGQAVGRLGELFQGLFVFLFQGIGRLRVTRGEHSTQVVGQFLHPGGPIVRVAAAAALQRVTHHGLRGVFQGLGQIADPLGRHHKAGAARIRRRLAHEDAQQRGLAAAVGTHQAHALAGIDDEIGFFEKECVPESLAEIGYL